MMMLNQNIRKYCQQNAATGLSKGEEWQLNLSERKLKGEECQLNGDEWQSNGEEWQLQGSLWMQMLNKVEKGNTRNR